ncbi:hypothetical protein GA0070616_2071 [Micromonospora nigra]|uniref:Nitrate and nitrite sensing n=1 Tax=Micromonospora nigra TaxID=145857 RepID=A0A1C6RUJ4_9ACTN|nr:hypothetical protein [Micromonospora nigra]SCL20729.1 hypothetical protein GA0070616_2071 [Micromonospora nigra]
MTVPAPRVRRRPSLPGRALPILLVVAVLAPLALLFGQTWQLIGDDRDLAARERLGVEYLRALGPVTDALATAQTAAVSGQPGNGAALTRAVEEAAAVDARLGEELRTQERWAGLRARIEALRGRAPGDPVAAFTAYGEVTDLLLELYRKVRESSGLIRDPRTDSFFLQDAVGQDLPTAVVAAGRLSDLALLATRRPAADRDRTLAELAGQRTATLATATGVVTDLRAALDTSESTDLGTNVLTPLDTYQRSVEAMAAYSQPTGRGSTIDPGPLGAARATAQSTATDLGPVILDELDAALADRVDGLDTDRRLALAGAALALVLLAALGGVLVAAARRAARRAAEARRQQQAQREAEIPSTVAPWSAEPLTPAIAGREPEPTQWRAFDAAR